MLPEESLLIKYSKKNQKYYAHTFNGKHIYYKFLGLVNKNKELTNIKLNPQTMFFSEIEKVPNEIKKGTQYTINGFDKKFKNSNKTILFYELNPNFDIDQIPLDKKVRGLRYTTIDEKKIIEDEVVKFWCDYIPISLSERLYNSNRYCKLWEKCMEMDIMDSFFRYMD